MQVLNFGGSFLFVALLGGGAALALAVPVANAVSLAANALADAALARAAAPRGGAELRWALAAPALALVVAGISLCASPAP